MHVHPFSLLTYFVHEQKAPSFVLTRFIGVYKGKLAFEVASRQNDHRPAIFDLGSIAERQTGTSELSVKQTHYTFFKQIIIRRCQSQNINLLIAYHNIVQVLE